MSETKKVPIGVSARHLHLSQEHVEVLFGAGAGLTVMKLLSQPGQFAANETVEIHGPKGSLAKVRILGPARKATQLEVSRTDAFMLGANPPMRESGNIADTPGFRIVGPAGEVSVDQGMIVAARHIHLHTSDAEQWGISDKQQLKVRVGGERGVIFERVIARISDQFALDMHIDTDEGNAAGVSTGEYGEIVE
ncbi:MAG: propanediol utilization phosphotransacylase [Cohnella sp.]|nr:propanediol utilization phosphotransacylase [Cohnella sp.]